MNRKRGIKVRVCGPRFQKGGKKTCCEGNKSSEGHKGLCR